MDNEPSVSGMVVSADPVVTFSKRSVDWPLGLASARPDRFAGCPALHLVGFSTTSENLDKWKGVADDVAEASRRLPQSQFVCLTNSEYEAYLLSSRGTPSMLCSQAIFLDETIFRPLDVPQRFDAIYNARFAPFKRHELAREVKSLSLLYDIGPPGLAPLYDETRALLPDAVFINHEAGQGAYRQLNLHECAAHLNQARVGLCLSPREGVMQAAIEYLLCGLPVVSTRSLGGRDRYFLPPFCRIVADDPADVARAVEAFARRPPPKQMVRSYIMHFLRFDRHNFLLAVNRLVEDIFGVANRFESFAPFEVGLTRWRTVDAAMAPLDEADA